jgi:hypothetical protein
MVNELSQNFKKLQIFAAISLLLLSTLFLFRTPGITGHFSADFKSQIINMDIEQSQIYALSTNNPEPTHISSFRLSGEVIGEGSVEVYIESKGQRLLVYKNVREKEKGLPAVTGMAVAYAAEPEEQETLLLLNPITKVDWSGGLSLSENQELVEGPFSNKCVDTCYIEMPVSSNDVYNLLFMVQPGTKLKINKITYNLKNGKI